jgi:hypothetical protein
MSTSTPDLVPSTPDVNKFNARNDLHIYMDGSLFFGERHPSVIVITAYPDHTQAFEPVPMSLGGICALVWTQ